MRFSVLLSVRMLILNQPWGSADLFEFYLDDLLVQTYIINGISRRLGSVRQERSGGVQPSAISGHDTRCKWQIAVKQIRTHLPLSRNR